MFTPGMSVRQIQATVDAIANRPAVRGGQHGFGATKLSVQVGYDTTVAGLGQLRATSTASAAAAAATRSSAVAICHT